MRRYGQQQSEDTPGSPLSFNELYAQKIASEQLPSAPRVEGVEDIVSQTPQTSEPLVGKDMAQGFSRGMSGGLGSGLMSAGITGMAGAAGLTAATGGLAAGGLAVMALEQNAKAKQAQSEAEAIEAQNRKQAQLSAINNMIAVTKGLGA